MQITTLGPLAVDGQPVRGERLAAVVRELVEARGRAVSTAALVDAVWDGTPPEDATGAIQALVSRVRRLGLPVVAVPGGYRVPPDQVTVDTVEVKALVDRARGALRAGDPATGRQLADQARALIPEVPELDHPDGRRLLADVAALRAQLALAGHGPFGEADLRRLVAHPPPDEPSAALLVRVLAAQGRDAEALEVVERLRAELAERYGKDPSPVVAQAHLALLRGELAVGAAVTRELAAGDLGTSARPTPQPPAGPPRRQPLVVLPTAWRRPATPLIGRDKDVAAVTGALADASLVTVVATGGAGKTRLVAEIARGMVATGVPVRVVELAGLRSPDEVLPAVLAAVGGADPAVGRLDLSPERRGLSLDDRWRLAVRDLEGLVVLDNCEHLLDAAAATVAALLDAAPPDVSVLATSRAPLSLVGEVVYRLRELPDDDALGLLRARLQAGGGALGWDADRALELCHRLDNLPLALELAAARLRHMPIADVLAGLTDRFALLDDALRGLPERHASLWALVDWSRELLAPEDRDLLQRLAVIPAPFTAVAAAMVAGVPDVRRGLATLVEQSLLALEESDGGLPRYRMLETVREYGDIRLDAASDRGVAMAGLVTWARGCAVTLAADLIGAGQLGAFDRCAAEQDNLVAAARWSIAHDDEAAAVDITAALFHVWTVRGLHHEIVVVARALLRADDPAARRHSPIARGSAAGRALPNAERLGWTCLIAGVNGGIVGSHRVAALAVRALRTLFASRAAELSPRLTALGSILPAVGSPDPAMSLTTAEGLIRNPDPYVQAFGLLLRAAVRENQGSPGGSLDDAEQAYRRFEAVGDHWGMGMAAQGIGEWIDSRGKDGSDVWLRRGVRHMELIGAVQDAESIRLRLDLQLALAGDQDAALRLRSASVSVSAPSQGRVMDVAQAHLGLAQLAWQEDRYDDAVGHAETALRFVEDSARPVPQMRVVTRIVVAIQNLWGVAAMAAASAADRAATPDEAEAQAARLDRAEARAVALLALARAEALAARDMPVLGSWAVGGAVLAAHRGETERARELWALGTRLGANIARLFQHGYGERLTVALGDSEGREPLLAAWRERSVDVAVARVTELMDELLG